MVILALLLGSTVPLAAQSARVCGDLPPLGDELQRYAAVFTAPEFAWVRQANGFDELAAGVPSARVTDDHECGRVVERLGARVREVLPDTPEGRQARRDGYRYAVFRVGPYYVVPLQPLDSGGALAEGYEIVNVFRVETLEFVGDFLN